MPEERDVKVGDVVLVKAKVVEVRETQTGKKYKVEIETGDAFFNSAIISGRDIVE